MPLSVVEGSTIMLVNKVYYSYEGLNVSDKKNKYYI